MRVIRTLCAAIFLTILCAACNLPAFSNNPTPEVKVLSVSTATSLPANTATQPQTETPLPSSTPTPQPAPTQETSLTAQTNIPPGWKTYTNQNHGFEVSFPGEGSLVETQPGQIRIDLPLTPGTNLSEKYLQIDLRTNVEECGSPSAIGYDPSALRSENIMVNGSEFFEQSGSEGAAGNYYDWVGYSTTRDDACISLTFVLHSLDPYNFETPPPVYDSQSESQVFDQVLNTFTWLP